MRAEASQSLAAARAEYTERVILRGRAVTEAHGPSFATEDRLGAAPHSAWVGKASAPAQAGGVGMTREEINMMQGPGWRAANGAAAMEQRRLYEERIQAQVT